MDRVSGCLTSEGVIVVQDERAIKTSGSIKLVSNFIYYIPLKIKVLCFAAGLAFQC